MAQRREVKVNCGSCRACCHQLVSLRPSDLANGPWELDPVFLNKVLKRRPDGSCVYLDAMLGCTIYDRRPEICRVFDCGDWYTKLSPEDRRGILIEGDKADKEMLASGEKHSAPR